MFIQHLAALRLAAPLNLAVRPEERVPGLSVGQNAQIWISAQDSKRLAAGQR